MAQFEYARFITKASAGPPTVPVSASHDNGDWLVTDIYENELYEDSTNGELYTRVGNVIVQLSSVGGVSSFNARTGVVVAEQDDYTAAQVSFSDSATITSLTVQEAIEELEGFINGKADATATAAALNTKVDKIAGKGLTEQEFTNADRLKLDSVDAGASANESDAYLTNRSNHTGTQAPATVVQDANNRFTTDAEKASWNAKVAANIAVGALPQFAANRTVDVNSKALNFSQVQELIVNAPFGGNSFIFHASAVDSTAFAVNSFNGGFLAPSMATAQRLAITAPVQGLQVYDLDLSELMHYSSGWRKVAKTSRSIQAWSSNPADSTTYYLCDQPQVLNTNVAFASYKNGAQPAVLTSVQLRLQANGAAGGPEVITAFVRVNNTTDYLIGTVGAATAQRDITNLLMNVPIPANATYSIKLVMPNWPAAGAAGNPTNLTCAGTLTLQ